LEFALGRPEKPLISRDRAARAALGVIDVHGLEALSLELVSQRMGVKAPSLYYHFHSKAELLSEAAKMILLDVRIPEHSPEDWERAVLDLNIAVRRSILQHPNAAPLLLQFFPRRLLLGAYDRWIAGCPLPMEQRMVLIEGLEKLTFGSALFEAAYRAQGIEPMPDFDRVRLSNLAEAVRLNSLDSEATFIETLKRFLAGFHTNLPAPKAKPAAAPRATKPTAVEPAAKKAPAVKKAVAKRKVS
jgi:TetR/AcrR family tetracycline transcriptional repressor